MHAGRIRFKGCGCNDTIRHRIVPAARWGWDGLIVSVCECAQVRRVPFACKDSGASMHTKSRHGKIRNPLHHSRPPKNGGRTRGCTVAVCYTKRHQPQSVQERFNFEPNFSQFIYAPPPLPCIFFKNAHLQNDERARLQRPPPSLPPPLNGSANAESGVGHPVPGHR
jgi:hypothetical protein